MQENRMAGNESLRTNMDISGIVRSEGYISINVIFKNRFHSIKLEEGALHINEERVENPEVFHALSEYHSMLDREHDLPAGDWQRNIESSQGKLFSALSRHLG